MVELTQVRWRHLHSTHRSRLTRSIQGRRRPSAARGLPPHPLQDRLDVETRLGPALLDGPLHLLLGVFLQQLQDSDVMLASVARSVLPLQGLAELVEHGG